MSHRGAAAPAAKQAAEAGPSSSAPAAPSVGKQKGKGKRGSKACAAPAVNPGSHEGAMLLASLPVELLPRVLAAAAYPLSAWRPLPEGGSAFETIESLCLEALGMACDIEDMY